MNRFLINTIVTLALLLCISEVAAGGTVTVVQLLDGEPATGTLGEVSQDINSTNGICTITVTPGAAYSVVGVTAVVLTDGGNAQAPRRAPGFNPVIEVSQGDAWNTWMFEMPSEEYDVEVAVDFTGKPQAPVIMVQSTDGIFDDKVVSITADIEEGDEIIYSCINVDAKDVIEDAVYTTPITLSDVGCYTLTARLRRGQILSDADTATVYVLRQPQFTPEGGIYETPCQVMFTGLPSLTYDDDALPCVMYKLGDAEEFERYMGTPIIVNELTTITAYVMDVNSDGQELRSEEFSATYDLPVNYPLYIAGVTVNSHNKDNVLGDKDATVRYNLQTNTLSLYSATLAVNDTTSVIRSHYDNLVIDLHGTSNIIFPSDADEWPGYVFNGINSQSPSGDAVLTFTTDASNPGQLVWNRDDINMLIENFADTIYTEPLQMFAADKYIGARKIVTYGLTIGTTEVNSVNFADIFMDGTVKFDTDNTLVLNGANLTVPVISSLDHLNIYLQGENTISCDGDLLISTVADAELSFETSLNIPGKLTLTKTTGEWYSGFNSTVTYKTNLTNAVEGSVMIVLDQAAIPPMNNEENPNVNVPVEETSGDVNDVHNDVLYTMPDATYEYEQATQAEPAGVILKSLGTTDETFYEKEPGSTAFAKAFTGLTFRLSAGTGNVEVEAKINADAKLAVQIGSDTPVLLPNETDPTVEKMHKYLVPYAVSEPTFVFVYVKQEGISNARADGTHRGRVLTGHVKVTSLGASSSSIVNNNAYSNLENSVVSKVTLYNIPAEAYSKDSRGLTLSTIDVGATTANSRPFGAPRRASELKKITELSPSLFDDIDKEQILYIDLSGTDINDLTINRLGGVMKGFSGNTMIYLPENNDDGGEDNVVINGSCASLKLDDALDFRAPISFDAVEAAMKREYVIGQTSTVFLPFTLSSSQASSLGTFHRFKEISGDNAVFYEAETGDIHANTPYIFLPAATELRANSVTVSGLDASTAVNGNLIGTYETIKWATDQDDIYGFAADSDGHVKAGQFVKVAAGAWIAPFRAYLEIADAPARLNIVFEGEGTGIDNVNVNDNLNNKVYDLQGRPVVQPKSGLYIQNGKKVFVK